MPHDSDPAAGLRQAMQLHQAGYLDKAAAAYAIALGQVPTGSPQAADILSLFGLLLSQQKKHAAARPLLEQALQISRTPKLLLAYALCLRSLGQNKQALPYLDEFLQTMPTHVEAHRARAAALFELGRYVDALPSLDIVATARPDQIDIQVTRLFTAGMLCRWLPDEDRVISAKLAAAAPDISISPFPLTFFTTDPGLQREWNERRAVTIVHRAGKSPPAGPQVRTARDSRRIRVGYLSCDFGNHAVGHIMAELFELHDRSRFDIRLLSGGRDDGSAIRQRYTAIEGFSDLHHLPRSAQEAAIRAADLDILVDLQGHTTGNFLDMLSRRPAPVQIDWIGYPGTIGGGFIDYIVADHIVIPENAEQFYSERIIRLPHCYQPNNRDRPIAPPLNRKDYGLPEDAVVFCSFSRPVKIRPPLFAAWMDILRAIPNSILWLYAPYPETAANLRQAATDHGIPAERLVFAGAVGQPAYLARYQVADLTLDTFPYGSHSTGSDSLWAGCPLLTLLGDTFPSRVAGSILSAIGLPRLATDTLDEYKALAIRLGQDPAELAGLRRTLQENRLRMPLFDTPRMVRDVEAAWQAVWDLHRRGLAPQHIALPPAGS